MGAEKPTLLYAESAIQERVTALARQISSDYTGVECLCLVGVLKGAFIFLADLARRLTVPHRVDFVALASYGESTTSDGVRLIMDLRGDIEGQHVLIVDDIMDTGTTLHYLVKMLAAREPASIKTCALIRKSKPRPAANDVDYVGFDIPDVWVVGYGLDWADRYRTLPDIRVVDPESSMGKD